jgi:uracil-DNA glycosylase
MVVAEALGKDEEQEGMALVGKSGYQLFQQLKRIDIEREDFTCSMCSLAVHQTTSLLKCLTRLQQLLTVPQTSTGNCGR